MANNIGVDLELYDKFSATIGEFGRSIQRATQVLDKKTTGSASHAKKEMSRFKSFFLAQMATMATRGVLRLTIRGLRTIPEQLKAASAEGEKYELQQIEVQKTTGLLDKELQSLSSTFDKFAVSTGANMDAMMGLAGSAGRLGIKGVVDVANFAKTFTMLETATDITADMSEDVIRLLNTLGVGISVVDNFGSAVAYLGDNVASGERRIVGMTSRLSGMAKLLKMTPAQVLGVGAAIAETSNEAEMAGTAFQQVASKMMGAFFGGKEVDTFASVMGVSIAEFKNLFARDANEALLKFLEGIKKIQTEGGNIPAVFSAIGTDGTRVTKVISDLADRVDFLRKHQKDAAEQMILNTKLTQEYGKKVDSSAMSYNRFKNSVLILRRNLGLLLNDGLKPVWEAFSDIASSDGAKKTIQDIGIALAVPLIRAGAFMKTIMAMRSEVAKQVKGMSDDEAAAFQSKGIDAIIGYAKGELGRLFETAAEMFMRHMGPVVAELINTLKAGMGLALEATGIGMFAKAGKNLRKSTWEERAKEKVTQEAQTAGRNKTGEWLKKRGAFDDPAHLAIAQQEMAGGARSEEAQARSEIAGREGKYYEQYLKELKDIKSEFKTRYEDTQKNEDRRSADRKADLEKLGQALNMDVSGMFSSFNDQADKDIKKLIDTIKNGSVTGGDGKATGKVTGVNNLGNGIKKFGDSTDEFKKAVEKFSGEGAMTKGSRDISDRYERRAEKAARFAKTNEDWARVQKYKDIAKARRKPQGSKPKEEEELQLPIHQDTPYDLRVKKQEEQKRKRDERQEAMRREMLQSMGFSEKESTNIESSGEIDFPAGSGRSSGKKGGKQSTKIADSVKELIAENKASNKIVIDAFKELKEISGELGDKVNEAIA